VRRLRPDFALATAVLLLTLSVAVGVAVGPPPRTVSQPPVPATNVATLDRAETASGETPAGAPRRVPAERGAGAGDRVAASVPSDGGPEQVAEPAAPVRSRARPVRIVRAAAKRPVFAAGYHPVIAELAAAPDPEVAAPAPRMFAALTDAEVQAP